MSKDYGWEKFHGAIYSLTADLPVRERLIGALAGHLIHIDPENDLPAEIVEEFKQLMKDLTKVEAKGEEGTIAATVNSLSDLEVMRSVEKLISLHDTVTRHQGPM